MARIGIIGGLGAMAGVRMAQQLVELSQERGANRDEDFPDFLLLNVPARGMSEKGLVDPEFVFSALRKAVKLLSHAKCKYIVVACNTAHVFHTQLNNSTHAEVLNMIEAAADAVKGCKAVGVIGSETTKAIKLYGKALAKRGIREIRTTDKEQDCVNNIINQVIAGRLKDIDRFRLAQVVDNLGNRGAERTILGCTELPVALLKRVAPRTVDAGREVMKRALSLA
jgi:aspartate racemase